MNFRDYKNSAEKHITIFESAFYPDFLSTATSIYESFFDTFEILLNESTSSVELLEKITLITGPDRIQLLRLFRRYISPNTSVEMLKVKSKIPSIIENFSTHFRDIEVAKSLFNSRPKPDEALCALLYEQATRGEKGYLLTQTFFTWFRENFGQAFSIIGPERAGKDVILSKHLPNFNIKMPADFLIKDSLGNPIVVGFARYDSDRGGAQEDDRIKGNRNNAIELIRYSKEFNNIKVIFLNDGPGLTLGSMWDDYSELEEYDDNILVVTLKMLNDRLTHDWLCNIN